MIRRFSAASKMQITIEKAAPTETEAVAAVLQESAVWLIEKGEKLWELGELDAEKIAEQVNDGMFWLARVNGETAGCVRFQLTDEEYWGDVPHSDSAFVHRLAVKRGFAGQGVSEALIDFAKAKAKNLGKKYLRLDCAERESLCRLYESFGFECHSAKIKKPYRVVRYQFRLDEL